MLWWRSNTESFYHTHARHTQVRKRFSTHADHTCAATHSSRMAVLNMAYAVHSFRTFYNQTRAFGNDGYKSASNAHYSKGSVRFFPFSEPYESLKKHHEMAHVFYFATPQI